MDKKELEEIQRKKSNEKFNSITNKAKVENQNQTHNVRKEGIALINQKRYGRPVVALFDWRKRP